MSETWDAFVRGFLYDAPTWVVEADWWWLPWLVTAGLWVCAHIQFWHLWSQDRPPKHQQIGWGRQSSSPVKRALKDYRTYAYGVFVLGALVSVVLMILHMRPSALLHTVGIYGASWELSVTGVDLLYRLTWMLWWASLIWLFIGIATVIVLTIDPYGYRRFRLLLVDPGDRNSLEFFSMENPTGKRWEPNEYHDIWSMRVWIHNDGCKWSVIEQASENEWFTLDLVLEKDGCRSRKKLKGALKQYEEDGVVWFDAGGGLPGSVEPGHEFFAGSKKVKIRFQ